MSDDDFPSNSIQTSLPLVGVSRDPLVDGRQSDRVLDIQRGACRCLIALGLAPVPEVTLATGRRADIAALSRTGDIWIVEIKSSLADFRADSKWEEYRDFCDRFLFAVDTDFPVDVIPEHAGLMIADRFGAEVVREAPEDRLSAARRKAVTLRVARQSALRMRNVLDPKRPS
ncbi:MAG: MmcB family DNA repair protein [Methyloligellaceae bacterium]